MSNDLFVSRRTFAIATAAATASAILAGHAVTSIAFAATEEAAESAATDAAESAAESAAEEATSGMTLEQLEAEAIPQASLAGEDTPETRGEVDATRTYVLQNACDETVTELYLYETPEEGEEVEDKGKNLAGDGLLRGEQVSVTVTGRYLHTEDETLFTCEYVVDGATYYHRTMHVEDLLFDKVIYLVGVDGVSSATAVSFSDSNL